MLGKHISHEQYTRAYSSDLIRARHTAELILKHSKFPVSLTTDKRLRERVSQRISQLFSLQSLKNWTLQGYGAAEGKYFAFYYEEAKRLGVRSEDYTPAGAETVLEVSARIQQFFTVSSFLPSEIIFSTLGLGELNKIIFRFCRNFVN